MEAVAAAEGRAVGAVGSAAAAGEAQKVRELGPTAELGPVISTQIVQFRALFIADFMRFLCTNRLQ